MNANAQLIVKNTTVYPFQLRGNNIKCIFCSNKYEDLSEFRAHMKERHEPFNLYTAFSHVSKNNYIKLDCTEVFCRICWNEIPKPSDIKIHLEGDHDIKFVQDVGVHWFPYRFVNSQLVCGICEENKPGLKQLSTHLTEHYSKFICPICKKYYLSETALRSHRKVGHPEEKYPCPKCKLSFPSLLARREHVLNTTACWRYRCQHCEDRFESYGAKEMHCLKKHGISKKTYPCTECAQVFPRAQVYRKHFMLLHSKSGFEVCAYCGKRFDGKRSLEAHLPVHTKEKQFKCQVCQKYFARRKSLGQHMWIHREEKRYQCVPCNRKFTQKRCWKIHMRARHPEVKLETINTQTPVIFDLPKRRVVNENEDADAAPSEGISIISENLETIITVKVEPDDAVSDDQESN